MKYLVSSIESLKQWVKSRIPFRIIRKEELLKLKAERDKLLRDCHILATPPTHEKDQWLQDDRKAKHFLDAFRIHMNDTTIDPQMRYPYGTDVPFSEHGFIAFAKKDIVESRDRNQSKQKANG